MIKKKHFLKKGETKNLWTMCVGGGCNKKKKKLEIKERQMRKKKYTCLISFIIVALVYLSSLSFELLCVQDNELTIRDWANHVVTVPLLHDYTFSLLSLPVCLSVFFLIFLDTDGISLRNI